MSNQQHQTAEKSVQTHDLSGSTTVLVNPENTATEVANTLVSMATGRQRGTTTTVKQLVKKPSKLFSYNSFLLTLFQNVINVSNQSASLPIISLADYTTSRGVPTATALANQAKLTPRKQEINMGSNDDDALMLSDEYNQTQNESNSTMKTRRGKQTKSISTSKTKKQQSIEPIQYGPILVKPRKQIAPTLANGRKSKDEQVKTKTN
jgi:hypothetical protein